MRDYGYTLEGELPAGYPEPIQYAWFATPEACEKYDIPSFEGFLSLEAMTERYPAIMDSDANLLSELVGIVKVEEVEDCTIIV